MVYASERDGYWNLYQATITRKEDYNFTYATLIDERPLFDNDGIERSNPEYSPDGKEIAFIENRNILKVYNVASKEVRQITDGTQHYGSIGYEWSPDGKWFAVTLITHMRDPYSDVGIVSAKGDKKIYNITESAYIDHSPTGAEKALAGDESDRVFGVYRGSDGGTPFVKAVCVWDTPVRGFVISFK